MKDGSRRRTRHRAQGESIPVVLDNDSLAACRVTIIKSVTQIPTLGKEAEPLITARLSSVKPWQGLPFLVIPWHIDFQSSEFDA